jgi:cation:H+ antiporter
MDILTLLLSFAIILIGCEFFTNSVEWVGKRFNLSEGAVGSVLAAVGTAMPETLIPIIAIVFLGDSGGEEIGVGAILGAPFMLATLAMFVMGVSVLAFRKRRQTNVLHINGPLIRRDLRIFIIAYSLAAVAAFVPPELGWLRWVIGFSLIPLYIYYVYLTIFKCKSQCEEDVKGLYFNTAVCRLRGGRNAYDKVPDTISEGFRKAVYTEEPPTYLIFVQLIMGLTAIILGANLFVQQIDLLAEEVGLDPLILALIIAPIATELPEKFNSILWIKDKKDTYAMGNITGAMVFQSCIPVTIGILLTDWHIDLSNNVQFLQACAIGIALLSGSVLYLRAKDTQLHWYGLMLGGALYVLFILLVLTVG